MNGVNTTQNLDRTSFFLKDHKDNHKAKGDNTFAA